MTETHSDDGNTQWWRKHTVMTETHSDDGNRKDNLQGNTQKWTTYRDTGYLKKQYKYIKWNNCEVL